MNPLLQDHAARCCEIGDASLDVCVLIRLCKETTLFDISIVNYRPTVDRERTNRFASRRSA
jgi:hypothetical protein